MTISVEETVESGKASIGESNRSQIEYLCICSSGSETEQDCDTAAYTTSPATFRGYERRALSGETLRMHPTVIRKVTVDYGTDQQQTPQTQATVETPGSIYDNATFTFNVVGGTELIKTALSTVSHPAGFSTDIKKVIGLDLKTGQVRGVNIFAPVCDFSFTCELPNATVTPSFLREIARAVGKTNSTEFAGFAIGEVLCRGARASKKGDERWQLSAEFAFSENITTPFTVGGITVTSKKGWEYLDVMYREDTSNTINGQAIQIPAQVNVHRVYRESDFLAFRMGN